MFALYNYLSFIIHNFNNINNHFTLLSYQYFWTRTHILESSECCNSAKQVVLHPIGLISPSSSSSPIAFLSTISFTHSFAYFSPLHFVVRYNTISIDEWMEYILVQDVTDKFRLHSGVFRKPSKFKIHLTLPRQSLLRSFTKVPVRNTKLT